MNILHTLADVLSNFLALHIQQAVVGGLDLLDKLRQLPNAGIGLRHGKDRRHRADDVQRVRIRREVVSFLEKAGKPLLGIVEHRPLRLEEHLHAFHIFGGIEKIILPLHHPFEQCNIVLALAQNVVHQVTGSGNGFFFGVTLFGVELVKELLIVALLGFKGVQNEVNQPVLIGGNVHRAQIVPQEVDALADQLFGGCNTPRDNGFVNLGLLAQKVHQPALFLADNRAAIVDLDFLLDDQTGNQSGNVDLLPAVGNRLIPALHIAHRGLEHLLVLQLQPLTDLIEGVFVVRPQPGEADLFISAVEDSENIGIAVHELIDHVELGIDALDKALHRLVQLVLRRAVFQVKDFAVDIELALNDGFFDQAAGVAFQLPRFVIAVADNPLDALRHLRHIPLLDILADLHRLFQLIKVGCVRRENNDCLVVDLRVHDKPLISNAVEVACHGDNAKPHSASGRAVQRLVNVLIVGEVILAVFIFLCRIDFAVDRLRNTLDDLCAVNRRILDVDGNILFLIRQEGVGIAIAGDVVLRQKAFQRSRDGRAKGNLVRVNIVDHQDGDVLDVRLDIFNVADKVEQLEDVHVLLLQAVVGIRRILAAVDDAADGTL